MPQKLLVITYYWPPSGGPGVQRWLKLSKYLTELGVEVHVLTVDENSASYMQRDEKLIQDIHNDIKVYKTNSFEPLNYYAKVVGKKNVPISGFSNIDNDKLPQKIINTIRSHLFIPDPRKGWKKYAYPKALEIIKREGIETVLTTGPPQSTHLIGEKLKRNANIKWLCDFRDPWTDIYYYKHFRHSCFSNWLDKKFEKKVLVGSDKIITVSNGFKEIFLSKPYPIDHEKITVIPNGFDDKDFNNLKKVINPEKVVVTYTGTMSDQYKPEIFFDALKDVSNKNPDILITYQHVGVIAQRLKEYIVNLGIPMEHVNTVPHEEINNYQINSTILLLVIPDVNNGDGIVPGKLFEYLATKNCIISIGSLTSDVAKIITECHAGNTFDRSDKESISNYLTKIIQMNQANESLQINEKALSKYSRKFQANLIKELF